MGQLVGMGRNVPSQMNASQSSQKKYLMLASGYLGLETLRAILSFVQTFSYKGWVWGLSC